MAKKMTTFGEAFRMDIHPYSGGWRDQSSSVKRRISQLTKDAKRRWIGKYDIWNS